MFPLLWFLRQFLCRLKKRRKRLQQRLFRAALDELASTGEPVNRVFEVDLDGGEVTLTLYDLPPAAP